MKRRRIAIAALVVGALGVLAPLAWIAAPLSPGLLAPTLTPGVVIEDRDGIVLRATRATSGARHSRLALDEVDPDLIAAVLLAEDRRFFEHAGIDARAMLRALVTNLRAGRVVAGGSTVTMQLARMLRGTPRNLTGKVAQMFWALRLERHFTKQQLLEEYLNRVPLGQGAIGADAAAALYFAASARDLSLAQAATLAAVIRSPSATNPIVGPQHARVRRNALLARLAARGYASAEAIARAREEPVLDGSRRAAFLAPHFTTYLLRTLPADGAGGHWRTTLDGALQEQLEAEVRHTVAALGARGARHAAAVVLDNRTGGVLAWVGSPDFWADTAGQVDMVVSARQPGSALKPFVYALAFDRGRTAATILADIPRVYQTSGGAYSPRNYDRRFHGPVRAREALGSSYNVPAVELADGLGAGAVLETLRRAGFVSLDRDPEHYGLGLALGNGDVTLLELANAYRALANGGVWRPHVLRSGEVDGEGVRVVSERAALLVLDVLADPVARAPGFGFDTPLEFAFPVAAKTGTSRHFTDNWAVAVTQGFTVAVWVGNFSGRPMDGVSGVSGAAPLLHRAVVATAKRHAPGALASPASAGLVRARVCRLSGLAAGRDCPGMDEWFAPGSEPGHVCDWHRDGDVRLPAAFAEWVATTRRGSVIRPVVQRTEMADTGKGVFRIVSPRDGDRYRVSPGVPARYSTIALRTAGGDAATVRWFVDEQAIAGSRWALSAGSHRVRAESANGRHEVEIHVD